MTDMTGALKKSMRAYNFKTAKSLGQNFLSDSSVLEDIVTASGAGADDLVIEIGPGPGTLTAAFAEKVGRVAAIEIDQRIIPMLRANLCAYGNVSIINDDIMKVDLAALIEREAKPGQKVFIAGNLPYYITTPIIMMLLESKLGAESITVMVQKEVADRMTAEPGGRDYGVLTVSLNYYGSVSFVRSVERDLFVPPPKVDSAVVKIDILKQCPVDVVSQETFFRTVRAGFSQRRKTLANSLAGAGFEKSQVSTALASAGIEAGRRAETLSIEEFARLSNELEKERSK